MSTQHTEGAWRVVAGGKTHPFYIYSRHTDGGSSGAIAMVPASTKRPMQANAHLIAAAPDLYEALFRLLQQCPTYSEFDDPEEHLYGAALERAHAALAKAVQP
jgi:hypothetical protein